MQPTARTDARHARAATAHRARTLHRLGKGAYGIVWKAAEKRKEKEKSTSGASEKPQQEKAVALKKIFDAFQNSTDAQRTYREIVFLQQFRGHENIIRLEEVLKACLLYTSLSPRDRTRSRMPSSA